MMLKNFGRFILSHSDTFLFEIKIVRNVSQIKYWENEDCYTKRIPVLNVTAQCE